MQSDLETGISISNLTQYVEVCQHSAVLSCPVEAENLRWADPLSKDSYQRSRTFIVP
jgi:hypothetical protein